MLAAEVGAAALAAFTRSGRTARILSKLRPTQPIFAFCERESTARELCLWRGVVPVIVARQDVDAVGGVAYELSARRLLSAGTDVVVVGAAPDGPAGRTNFVRLVRVR
jgi:pyruvate kinase